MPAATALGSATGGKGSSWGKAIEVPGLGALNTGRNAEVNSVSCASAGNCSAGGYYLDGSDHVQAFVVSEKSGAWGKAIEVPGSAALNVGGVAQVLAVSCASAGNCSAGGFYQGATGAEAFVVSQKNGTWRNAIEVPGSGTLNTGGNAQVSSVSCGAVGNCAAAGTYNESGTPQAFVANERNGTWSDAIEVPGSGTLNAGGNASAQSVSCASVGNCSVGGSYSDRPQHTQAYVVSEQGGYWGNAIEVPGSGTLNTGVAAGVNSVSCASAGNCSAAGAYGMATGLGAFVVSQKNGTWGNAIEVPGSGTLNAGGNAQALTVSCGSAGNCAAAGDYTDGSHHVQAFVVSQRNGAWGKAIEVPGSGTLNAGGNAGGYSVSCASAGNCVAGGYYSDASGAVQAFVVPEVNRTWHKAIEVPGTAALNTGGNAVVLSVSCTHTGSCAAGGQYLGSSGLQGFVVSNHGQA
jgi:hypothetical protein